MLFPSESATSGVTGGFPKGVNIGHGINSMADFSEANARKCVRSAMRLYAVKDDLTHKESRHGKLCLREEGKSRRRAPSGPASPAFPALKSKICGMPSCVWHWTSGSSIIRQPCAKVTHSVIDTAIRRSGDCACILLLTMGSPPQSPEESSWLPRVGPGSRCNVASGKFCVSFCRVGMPNDDSNRMSRACPAGTSCKLKFSPLPREVPCPGMEGCHAEACPNAETLRHPPLVRFRGEAGDAAGGPSSDRGRPLF